MAELNQTDCEQLLSHLKHQEKLLKLKRRWLMGLQLSDSQVKKIFSCRPLPESLFREDDIFYVTVKTYVEESFGVQNSERGSSILETEQLFERDKMRRILLSCLDTLTNTGLYNIAVLLTRGSVKFDKTRCKMKKVIKESIQELFKVQNDDSQIERLRKLSQLLNDPQNVRENCVKLCIPTLRSHRDVAVEVLKGLEDLPSQTLIAMRNKLRGVPADIPSLQQNRHGWSRHNLIDEVRQISQNMLSELGAGDELQAPLAKALAIAGLSLKVTLGYTSTSVTDFNQFSPEIKLLQNEIAKAIWILKMTTKVRVPQLKSLQLLLDPNANISNSSLRTALKKLLTGYLFECNDLATIPKSLLKALSIIKSCSRSSLSGYFLKEDIDEEVECILNVSAQTKQIVWDFFPEHAVDEDYRDAYMEELEESDDGNDDDDNDDDVSVAASSVVNDDDQKFEVGNFYGRSHSIDLGQREESIGEHMLVDFKLPNENTNSLDEVESVRKFGESYIKENNFSPPFPPIRSLNFTSIKGNEPEHDAAMKGKDSRFEGESLVSNKHNTNKNLYLVIQDMCDETSMVTYNLIGRVMDGLAREEGLDSLWSDSSCLRSDYSCQENEEEKQIPSEKKVSASVIVQVAEKFVPSIPKSGIDKLKELMGI